LLVEQQLKIQPDDKRLVADRGDLDTRLRTGLAPTSLAFPPRRC
jgi:hypothetical protein